ncbi:hypothetical protein H6G94_16255 [Nostoc punctiforme FACHB-252]|jgi:hypothetical protein|uniref:Restriction endonuclease subunit R n=1 Tax=Nostoc punctiforme FACHB-252 TaxID=1357509 RepID=A0ABR8HC59_NOSPU|nr:hypothetical protein [Nostoc punctiforme]MBD2612807.1 hypothetical protein [Nostoc punctiforme FACHB-252]
MAFSNYKTISEVLKEFQIIYTESDFIKESEFNIPDYFREDLAIVMREGVVDNSEFAICENLIYPVLKEVWKKYSSKFTLWSHQALNYDERLSGFPEYLLARRSPLGKVVFDKPYFILVEAKQDNFEAGWAQCLAEMIAAQRLNEEMTITIFGIVSNGDRWQFANLNAQVFTKNITFYSIQELDKLFAAVNYLFQQCQLQLNNLVSA